MTPVSDLHVSENVDGDSSDYPFAKPYEGSPVKYEIPSIFPVDIKSIPTAAVASELFCDGVPTIQPITSPNRSRKHSKDFMCQSESVSPTSVIAFDQSVDHHEIELSGEISSSGALRFSNEQDIYQTLSDGINSSGALGLDFSNELSCDRLSDHIDSSGVLGTSIQNEWSSNRQYISGEVGNMGLSSPCRDPNESEDFANRKDWTKSRSTSGSKLLHSDTSSCKDGEDDDIPEYHLKKTISVKFCNSETKRVSQGQSSPRGTTMGEGKKDHGPRSRKGSCYRCLKGNRFTDKEVCMVCDARYCSNCLLKEMGSMPEGRKCLSCIGFPIDESKRENLGKCSRLLKKLLSELEIQQIMIAEKTCEANQIKTKDIFVNGNPLSQEEMISLQNCANPLTQLKPGRYWYDRGSGLWGKEGQKPSKVIDPHLNVGGELCEKASNGNTGVFMNGREITKSEMQMLKLAGVQCAGNPRFWLHADGSYTEEGQKTVKGHIWGKTRTKLFCLLLALPIPSKELGPFATEVNLETKSISKSHKQNTPKKLLLVGHHGSGTSTIYKQTRFLYKSNPFSDDERENIKLTIQTNVYKYLAILLEGREKFEEEILSKSRTMPLSDQLLTSGNANEDDDLTRYSISPRFRPFMDLLLEVMATGSLETTFPAATREYAPLVEDLWKDPAVQATYKRKDELKLLPKDAGYFLERVSEISRLEYVPSDTDILHAEGVTSPYGLSLAEFSFPHSPYDVSDQQDLQSYQLIRVRAEGIGGKCKFLDIFEDIYLIIFCVALIEYDESYVDDETGMVTNKMLKSKKFFENLILTPMFEKMDFLLILNKFDLFEEKIEQIPLTVCDWFHDYSPLLSNKKSNKVSTPAELAFRYVATQFKKLFSSQTSRKLYVSRADSLVRMSIDTNLRYAREIIKWREEERAANSFNSNEYSTFYSTGPSP